MSSLERAYQKYVQFCEALGLKPADIKTYEKSTGMLSSANISAYVK
jgi:hypothetical protein